MIIFDSYEIKRYFKCFLLIILIVNATRYIRSSERFDFNGSEVDK